MPTTEEKRMLIAALMKRSVSVRSLSSMRHRLAAAARLVLLERETKRVPHSVVEDLEAELLHDQPEDVVLERPSQPRGEHHQHGDAQPPEHSADARVLRHVPGRERRSRR